MTSRETETTRRSALTYIPIKAKKRSSVSASQSPSQALGLLCRNPTETVVSGETFPPVICAQHDPRLLRRRKGTHPYLHYIDVSPPNRKNSRVHRKAGPLQ